MDLYQDFVGRYLERDPAVFLHHDITIRLEGAAKGNRWVIDLLAVHLKEQRACLCELEGGVPPSGVNPEEQHRRSQC